MAIQEHGSLSFGKTLPTFVGLPIDDIKEASKQMHERAIANKQAMQQLDEYANSIDVRSDNLEHKNLAIEALATEFNSITNSNSYQYADSKIYKAAKDFTNNKVLAASIQEEMQHKAWLKENKEKGVDGNVINAYESIYRASGKKIEIDEFGTLKNVINYKELAKTPDINKQLEDALQFAKLNKRIGITRYDSKGNKVIKDYEFVGGGQWMREGETEYTDDAAIMNGLMETVLNNPTNQAYFQQVKELAMYQHNYVDENGKFVEDENGEYILNPDTDFKKLAISVGFNEEAMQKQIEEFNNSLPNGAIKVEMPKDTKDFKAIYEANIIPHTVEGLAKGYTAINSTIRESVNYHTNQKFLLDYKARLDAAARAEENRIVGFDVPITFTGNPNVPANIGEFTTAKTNTDAAYAAQMNSLREVMKAKGLIQGGENIVPSVNAEGAVAFFKKDKNGNYVNPNNPNETVTLAQYNKLSYIERQRFQYDMSTFDNQTIAALNSTINKKHDLDKINKELQEVYNDLNQDDLNKIVGSQLNKYQYLRKIPKMDKNSNIIKQPTLIDITNKLKAANIPVSITGSYIDYSKLTNEQMVKTITILNDFGLNVDVYSMLSSDGLQTVNNRFQHLQDSWNATIIYQPVLDKRVNDGISNYIQTGLTATNSIQLKNTQGQTLSAIEDGILLGTDSKNNKIKASYNQVHDAVLTAIAKSKDTNLNTDKTNDMVYHHAFDNTGKPTIVITNLDIELEDGKTFRMTEPVIIPAPAELEPMLSPYNAHTVNNRSVQQSLNVMSNDQDGSRTVNVFKNGYYTANGTHIPGASIPPLVYETTKVNGRVHKFTMKHPTGKEYVFDNQRAMMDAYWNNVEESTANVK